MSTTVDWPDVDDTIDPDTLKVAEGPDHRRLIEVIGNLADHYVGDETVVYRDMNWYPPDGGNAVAPDLMTLPFGALESGLNSYRQPTNDLPFPGVVVEVPSSSDTFEGLLAKAARYSALGVDVYVVSTEANLGAARRLVPGSSEFVAWTGKPIAPLGGLSVEVIDGEVAIRTPDGRYFSRDSKPLSIVMESEAKAKAEAVAAKVEVEQVKAEVEQAKAEGEHLKAQLAAAEAKLRALGSGS